MKYIWDLPPKVKHKTNNIFGDVSNQDLLLTSICLVIAAVLFFVLKDIAIFIAIGQAALIGTGAVGLFILNNQYGENKRTEIMRKLAFNKSQKIYYFNRNKRD